ncbi:ORF MSV111 hypothetical protein [Melanoplus sanguinipes entomopoxvirus]|uniref:Uncharacterized protein n=1 Tax=Melanoplus sanguinipes entomopoxvirus TaxID=83191 RepID=Q9YVY1_MSEPV|nr:ORF MSV111 hypothetical protein [Melanoplus sanguinipes entomopoxvirus]AAC97656.1 ORF MSV111 hypothetical protein [Melanoplus sanguinipes entomopoxvirus 'O']
MHLLYLVLTLYTPIYGYILYNDKNITYECNNKHAINMAVCYDNNIKFCIIKDSTEIYIHNIITNNKTYIQNNLIHELFINKVLFCYDDYIFLIYNKYVFKYENRLPTVFTKQMNLTDSIPPILYTIKYYDKYFVINKLKEYSKSILKNFMKYYKNYKKYSKIKCKKKAQIYTYDDVIISEKLYMIIIFILILFVIFIAYKK